MKICILYTGQNRFSDSTKIVYEKFLTDNENEYFPVLCTWEGEDTTSFENYFPNGKVYKFNPDEVPLAEIWAPNTYIHMKEPENFVKMYYIRSKGIEALKDMNQNFDVVVMTRTDLKIYKNVVEYYNVVPKYENCVLTAVGPTWDILGGNLWYGTNGCPDHFLISNQATMETILSAYFDPSKMIYKDPNYDRMMVHPETSMAKLIGELNLMRIVCPYDAFKTDRTLTNDVLQDLLPAGYQLQPGSEMWLG